jgi:hypothetical protein
VPFANQGIDDIGRQHHDVQGLPGSNARSGVHAPDRLDPGAIWAVWVKVLRQSQEKPASGFRGKTMQALHQGIRRELNMPSTLQFSLQSPKAERRST